MTYTDRTTSLQQIKGITQQVIPSSTVILFGSRARSDSSSESDYDFMVVTKDVLNMEEKRKYKSILRTKLAKQKIPVDVLIETEQDVEIKKNISGHIVKEVMKDGIVL